jgi:hypothetical protein
MEVFLVIYMAEDERQEVGRRLEPDKEGTEEDVRLIGDCGMEVGAEVGAFI